LVKENNTLIKSSEQKLGAFKKSNLNLIEVLSFD